MTPLSPLALALLEYIDHPDTANYEAALSQLARANFTFPPVMAAVLEIASVLKAQGAAGELDATAKALQEKDNIAFLDCGCYRDSAELASNRAAELRAQAAALRGGKGEE